MDARREGQELRTQELPVGVRMTSSAREQRVHERRGLSHTQGVGDASAENMVKTIDSSASEGGVCKGAVCGAPGTTNDTGYADRHEPMTFENTPFPETEQSIFRSIRRRPLWRYIYVAALVAVDVLVMLLSLVICFAFNPGAYDTVTRAMPIWAFLLAYCVIGLLCLAFAGAYHRHVMAEAVHQAHQRRDFHNRAGELRGIHAEPATAAYRVDHRTVGRAGVRTGRPLDDAVPATPPSSSRRVQIHDCDRRLVGRHQ